MGPESVHEQLIGVGRKSLVFLSNTKIMASNGSGSFFVPQTPTPTKTCHKAEWEQPSVGVGYGKSSPTLARVTLFTPKYKLTEAEERLYKELMDDSSDSEVEVLNEQQIAQHLNEKTNKKSEDRGFDALDPPFVNDGTLLAMQLDQEERERTKFRFSKQHALKNIQKMSKDDCKLSPESEDELKKDLKRSYDEDRNKTTQLSKKMKRAARWATFTSTPDARLSYVKDTFTGAEKFNTLRAVDDEGIVYKRAILLDESIAHAFILSSNELMFKIDGDKVNYYTQGARGIVNITREKRIPFLRLFEKTFAHDVT